MPAPIRWRPDFEHFDTLDPEGEPWLTATPDGRFTLVYSGTRTSPAVHTDIREARYDSLGLTGSPGVSYLTVTTASSTSEHQPASAIFPDGRRIVVWTEESQAGGGDVEDVYAAIYFGGTGTVATPRFLVTAGAGRQTDPIVAANQNGFVVAVNDNSVAGGQLILKFYNIAGTLIDSKIASDASGVNTSSPDQFRDVEITALANGNYAVVWSAETGSHNTLLRVYASTGVAVTGVIDVDPGTTPATMPDVTLLADGRFVVTWLEFTVGEVRGRIYNQNGTDAGPAFDIGFGAANALDQQVQTAALHDGRFVVVWKTAAGEIAGQVMFADGTPDGAEFQVNTDTAGDQSRPTIAVLADGRFVVGFESGAGATPENIVLAIFDPREAGLLGSASALNDDWHGTNFADTVFLGVGDDRMSAAGGNDTIHGEAGNDFIFGDAGADELHGGNDGDTLDGGDDGDFLFGELGNDSIIGGSGNDSASGGDGNDTLRGGEGNDTLNGGTGNDSMEGGSGSDVYFVQSAGDIVIELPGGGKDLVNSFVTHTLAAGVENLKLAGALNINGTGNALANSITGSAGNNTLAGRAGNDTLTGGAGIDSFLFNAALNATNNVDTITDFSHADDRIRLDGAVFVGIGPVGRLDAEAFLVVGSGVRDAEDRIIYNATTGRLFYDADGNGAGAAVVFAILEGSPDDVSFDDFFVV